MFLKKLGGVSEKLLTVQCTAIILLLVLGYNREHVIRFYFCASSFHSFTVSQHLYLSLDHPTIHKSEITIQSFLKKKIYAFCSQFFSAHAVIFSSIPESPSFVEKLRGKADNLYFLETCSRKAFCLQCCLHAVFAKQHIIFLV